MKRIRAGPQYVAFDERVHSLSEMRRGDSRLMLQASGRAFPGLAGELGYQNIVLFCFWTAL